MNFEGEVVMMCPDKDTVCNKHATWSPNDDGKPQYCSYCNKSLTDVGLFFGNWANKEFGLNESMYGKIEISHGS
jgi:hypothetical protein